ncbi:MAG: GAF domain-containing protein [Actinomycetia bacterium]|nr:GAF domain-containing protein [Actinomycetes bacterium]
MARERAQQILTDLKESSQSSDPSLPQRLLEACAAALPVTGAGLLVMTNTGPGAILAATDGPARVMEELQFTLGEGPCIEATRSGRPVLQPDLAATAPSRWPGFAAGALDAGIGAIFAFPLQVGGIRVGVLDLYRNRPGPLADPDLAEALDFADAATTVLLHLQAQNGPDGVVTLLEDRNEVHQATGMISVQTGLGLADALLLLRAHSYAEERGILDVSRDVVSRIMSFAVRGRLQE